MSSQPTDLFSLIERCPHTSAHWFCDDCLRSNYGLTVVLSELAGFAALEGKSPEQVWYTRSTAT